MVETWETATVPDWRPQLQCYPRFSDIVSDWGSRIELGQTPVKQGLDSMAKDLTSYIYTQTRDGYDFSSLVANYVRGPNKPPTQTTGNFSAPFNGKGGSLRGLELSASVPLNMLTPALDGFGVLGSASFNDSSVTIRSPENASSVGDGPIALPGLSKRVASAAVFYDYGPFSARVSGNYRSSFLSDTQIAVTNQLVTFAPETVYDFQASYNITDQFKVVYQMLNLTNQPTRTYFGGNPQQTGTIQYFGRTSYLGVEFKL